MLETLLAGVTKARDVLPPSPLTQTRPKIVLKVAPDLDDLQIQEMGEVIRNSKIDGVIVSNTTIQRPKHLSSRKPSRTSFEPKTQLNFATESRHEAGGLSGAPVKPFSIKAMKAMRQQLPSSIPVIGCGGIASGRDALEYAQAGASMVQVYTSFGYDGVGTCRRIKDELVEELKKEGASWKQIAGRAVEELSWKAPPPPPANTVQQLITEAEELKGMLEKLEVDNQVTL